MIDKKNDANKNNVSRRKFIKGGVALSAAAGLSTIVGGKATKDVVQAFGVKELDEFPIELSPDFKRYDEKNTVFCRAFYDSEIINMGSMYNHHKFESGPGYTQIDQAFQQSAWTIPFSFGYSYGSPMYLWEGPVFDKKAEFESKETATKAVKKVAKYFGADLVGICKYEDVHKWVYEKMCCDFTGERHSGESEFPFKPKSVIVMAIEMDYDLMKTAPSYLAGASIGKGYSDMAITSFQLASFIRLLGYKSFAAGNNVAESVPIAIQAGLGELGRNGLLLTREYGPRVRLCKVFTEMELAYDKPIEFGGMKFCEVCKRCAEACPSESIPYDTERNFNTLTKSNHAGMKKWYVNVETCYNFWLESDSSCACCISACPYNKPNFWHHAITSGLTSTPIRPFLKYMDELFGYGKTFNEQAALDYWEKD